MTQRMKQYVKERWIFCTVIASLLFLIGATVTWTAAESQIFSVKQDNTAYTAGGATSGVSVFGGYFHDVTPPAVDEGKTGALRMSGNRNLYGTIRDAAGNERGANVTAANALETQVSAPLGSAAAAASVSIAPPTDAMFRVSDDTAANAVGNPIFTQCSPTAAANTVANPFFASVSDDGATNTVTNPIFVQPTNGTNGGDILAAIADDVALTNNPMVAQCMLGLYDGATMDMGRAGASGELQVTDIATRPGEDVANNRRDVKVVAIGTYAPAKTTTATLAAVELTLLAPVEVISYPNWTIYVKNLDGADAFVDLDIECSPDGTSWLELTAANFGVVTDCVDALGAGVMCLMTCRNCSCRKVQVQGTGIVNPNESSADVWITANVN